MSDKTSVLLLLYAFKRDKVFKTSNLSDFELEIFQLEKKNAFLDMMR